MAFEELAAWLAERAEADEFSGVVLIRRGANHLRRCVRSGVSALASS